MEATANIITVRVTDNGRWFAKTVKELRRLGGKFNPATKTWTVDANKGYNRDCLWAIRTSIQVVGGCTLRTESEGCPLHGETCN